MNEGRDSDIEPVRDPALRAALADAFGEQPSGVDWAAMHARATAAARFRLRGRGRVAPWWEQVTPWATRLLPLGAVAAAAAVAFAVATPRSSTSAADTTLVASAVDVRDPIADAVAAPNGSGAAAGIAGPVDDDWLWNATVAAPATGAR